MNMNLFLRIVSDVEKADDNFKPKRIVADKFLSLLYRNARLLSGCLLMARPQMQLIIEFLMGETVNTTVQFACTMVNVFGPEYLRESAVEDMEKVLVIGAMRGFPGMLV